MRILICIGVVGCVFVNSSDGISQTTKTRTKTLKVGNWSVERSIDNMTDKVICTGFHDSSRGVQLNDGELYVSVRGGLQGVKVRFGEKPVRPMRLVSESEKRIDAININGKDFIELLQEQRVRLEVLTIINGIKSEDLNLDGLQAALQHIRAGCPLPNNNAAVSPGQKPPSSKCDAAMLVRLKSAGVTAHQIKSVCE